MNERAILSRTGMEVVAALATAGAGAAVIVGAIEYDIGWGDSGPQPGYFPFRIGVLIVLGSLANLVLAVVRRDGAVFLTAEQGWRVLAFGLPILGFVTVSAFAGLYVGAVLYLFGVMVFQGGYRPLVAGALALTVAAVMRLVFHVWFKVPLLEGPLEPLLGL